MWFIILTLILIAGVYLASDYYFIYYNTHHIKIDNMHKIKTSNNSSSPKS